MVVLLAGWGFLASSCSPGGSTTTKKERCILVTGSADMEVVPNEFNVIVSIQEFYEKGKKVKLQTIQENLSAELDSMGIRKEDISIDEFGAYNRYWWYYYNRQDLLRSMQVTVKLHDIQSLGKFMTDVTTKGIYNITMGKMSHSDIRKFRLQVKSDALKAAREKAEFLLDGMGKKLGDVITIEEVAGTPENAYLYGWYGRMDYSNTISPMEGSGDVGEPNWQSNTLMLHYEVKAEFEIK